MSTSIMYSSTVVLSTVVCVIMLEPGSLPGLVHQSPASLIALCLGRDHTAECSLFNIILLPCSLLAIGYVCC